MSEVSCEAKWECYLCGNESDIKQIAYGWLGNYHMLCESCANVVYFNSESKFHKAMTYHYIAGEITLIENKIRR